MSKPKASKAASKEEEKRNNAEWVKVDGFQFLEMSFQLMLESLPSILYHIKIYGTRIDTFQVALLEKRRNNKFYCDSSFFSQIWPAENGNKLVPIYFLV